MTFPRFHRHLYKEEFDEIGGRSPQGLADLGLGLARLAQGIELTAIFVRDPTRRPHAKPLGVTRGYSITPSLKLCTGDLNPRHHRFAGERQIHRYGEAMLCEFIAMT